MWKQKTTHEDVFTFTLRRKTCPWVINHSVSNFRGIHTLLLEQPDINEYHERINTWVPEKDLPPPVQAMVNLYEVADYEGDISELCQVDYRYRIFRRGMEELKQLEPPFIRINWPQELVGDSSDLTVQVLLLTKDWEKWRSAFAAKALNQSWQDLPCLRTDAFREALEDVTVASWTQYPAPTPDTAYKWSREKKAYALFPKCKFWKIGR